MARTWTSLPDDRRSLVLLCLLRVVLIIRICLWPHLPFASAWKSWAGCSPNAHTTLAGLLAIPRLIIYALTIPFRRTLGRDATQRVLAPSARTVRPYLRYFKEAIHGGNPRGVCWHVAVWTLQRRVFDDGPPLTACEVAAVHDDDLSASIPSGMSLLAIAAKRGHLNAVVQLVERGALLEHAINDPRRKRPSDADGVTAIVLARMAGHVAVVRYLEQAGARLRSPLLRRERRRGLQWELERVRRLSEMGRCSLIEAHGDVHRDVHRDAYGDSRGAVHIQPQCFGRRGAAIGNAADQRLLCSLRIVSGTFGHVPDGPFRLILSCL